MKRFALPALFLLPFFVLPLVVLAQSNPTGGVSNPTGGVSNPIPVSSGTQAGQAYTVDNPIGTNSFCMLIKNLLQAAIQIGIPIAVLFIVYAGFKFVLARGKPEALAEARKNFLWTIIGIAIFLGAWLLASVIANTVNQLGGNQQIISCQ